MLPRHPLIAALFAFALLAAPARAEVKISDPWPDLSTLTAIQGQPVTFRSHSPFAPDDIPNALAAAPTMTNGMLFMPPGASAANKAPAVVFLHGASGVLGARELTYGPQLAATGIAALAVDTYGSRRYMADDFVGRVMHITETMFVADAYAALQFLAANPAIDSKRVVLTGFSYGGMATTFALYRQMADALLPNGPRFIAHVAYYGPCIAHFDDHRTTGAPLLMLQGADDILVPPAECNSVADELRDGGSKVEIIRYPGAVHQWDGEFGRRLIGHDLSPCRFRVKRDGTVQDERSLLPMDNSFLRKIILGMCVGGPYPIGRDDAVRLKSDADFGTFLGQVLAEPKE